MNKEEEQTLDQVKGYRIVKDCETSHARIDPTPQQADLDKLYREEYYGDEKPHYITRHLEDKEWWDFVYAGRYKIFEKLLDKDRREILDVGCGAGFFLDIGRSRGWTVRGVEPSKQAFQYAVHELGLSVENTFFNQNSFEETATFDAVHCAQVLEHVADPAQVLRDIHSNLNAGGIACIVVPNDYNPLQEILRKEEGFRPWWLVPPHHINYFNFKTLGGLLESCGFEVVERSTTFPMEWFLLMGDNYIEDDKLGRACHAKRKKFELTFSRSGKEELLDDLYAAISGLGLGREVIYYARKR